MTELKLLIRKHMLICEELECPMNRKSGCISSECITKTGYTIFSIDKHKKRSLE